LADIPSNSRVFGGAGIVRGRVTWYCYLLLGFFVFTLTMQGNIVPFLKQELSLSYRETGLHASAIAMGAIVVGLIGDKIVRRYGRRPMLMIGTLACAGGAVMLCIAPAAWASIGACAIIGLGASFIPTVAFAILADVHGERRNIAINESSAINYGLAVMAPLLTSLCLLLSLGWRSAVIIGAALGAGVVLAFRRVILPESTQTAISTGSPTLPSAYWAYWSAISFSVAIEFCILLWSPEFLAKIVGLTQAGAAAAAAAFVLAMFVGRVFGSFLARTIAVERLLVAQLAITLIGFLIYWSFSQPLLAISGLFVLGLGVSILFPLTVGLAIGAAGAASDTASARATIAFGIALLVMPVLLGSLADRIGLRNAHWLVPILIGGAFAALVIARALQRQPESAKS
jgi:MFS family permease